MTQKEHDAELDYILYIYVDELSPETALEKIRNQYGNVAADKIRRKYEN